MIPDIKLQHDSIFNQTSLQLNKLIRIQHGYLSRIDSIGAEMRDEVAIIADIAAAKLKVLEDLLLQLPEERDFEIANLTYQKFLQKASNETIECFENLLAQRDCLIENGKPVMLTKEKKNELIRNFAEDIEKKINKIFQLNIDVNSNLEQLRNDTKKGLDLQVKLHDELLKLKTGITENYQRTQSEVHRTHKIKEEIFANGSDDIWNACQEGDSGLLQKLVDKLWFWEKNEGINQKSPEGWTGLSLAVAYGHLDCVIFLLKNKANPNSLDNFKYSPMHWAAKTGNKKIAIELVKSKAIIDIPGEFNRTPLNMAAFGGKARMVQYLLKHNADINAQTTDHKQTALHAAIEQGYLSVVIELIQWPLLNVNLVDETNHSPLYYAIALGHTDIAALIVGHASWTNPTDLNDPNSIAKLRLLKPAQNAEQVQKFLSKYA